MQKLGEQRLALRDGGGADREVAREHRVAVYGHDNPFRNGLRALARVLVVLVVVHLVQRVVGLSRCPLRLYRYGKYAAIR